MVGRKRLARFFLVLETKSLLHSLTPHYYEAETEGVAPSPNCFEGSYTLYYATSPLMAHGKGIEPLSVA